MRVFVQLDVGVELELVLHGETLRASAYPPHLTSTIEILPSLG